MTKWFLFLFCLSLPFLVIGLLTPQRTRIKHGIVNNDFNKLRNKCLSTSCLHQKLSGYERKNLQLSAHTISLDTTILSGSKFGLQRLGFCILLITLIANRFFRSSTRFESSNENRESGGRMVGDNAESEGDSSARGFFHQFFNHLQIMFDGLTSKVEQIKGSVTDKLGWSREVTIKLDDWSVCKLQNREILYGGRYTRYRFELENSASSIPLYIGQEVSTYNCIFIYMYICIYCSFTLIFILILHICFNSLLLYLNFRY